MMKHVKFLLAMQLLSIAVFEVKATKDIEDYYEKMKRSADGTPTGEYHEKAKRDLSDEKEEYEDDDDDDEDTDNYYGEPNNKVKRQVQRTRKAVDEEREKREYEYYSRGKFARDIDDYVR
ncbi:rRNA-processing protein EFG1-like [Amblyraja radiata]|nr:rRNA-processing protein EFG1-like [Amblyraja radiata]XP_055513971.1 uncharacterized protein LOC129710764 isoform X2 [Leucoraja erinacea]